MSETQKTILIIDKSFKAIELQDRLEARPWTRFLIETQPERAMTQIKAGPDVIFLNPRQLSIQDQVILDNWRRSSDWLSTIPLYLLVDSNTVVSENLRQIADGEFRKPFSWSQLLDVAFQALDAPLRRNIRHDVEFTLEGSTDEGLLFKGRALNISQSGIFFESDNRLSLDALVTLHFLVHDRGGVFELEVCEVRAALRRHRTLDATRQGYGAEFIEQTHEQEAQIDALLSAILA
ncbi:MAG: PilZ domain-containing protein [Myxococcales bacterium]|nr:PilZ domain-containing protein [Myxococcales bacterium]